MCDCLAAYPESAPKPTPTLTPTSQQVVAAKLTPSKRELVVLCRAAAPADDASCLCTLTTTTISLATMKATVPRIDLPDMCAGRPPAFDLTQPVVTTGLCLGPAAGLHKRTYHTHVSPFTAACLSHFAD